jgi:hypothetical protein
MTALDRFLKAPSGGRGAIFALAAAALAELKTNRRAVLGLLAIALLAGGYGLLLLGDAVDAARGAYVEARLRRERMAMTGTRTDWPARARISAALRQSLEKRLWPADSDGVARADLQDWITDVGRKAGLDRLRVTIELRRPTGPIAEIRPDIREVIATVEAMQNESALMRFLDRIESEPRLLIVDRLHVQQQPVASLEMTLISYARIARPRGAVPR